MKSELLSMLDRHEKEENELRRKCPHSKKFIKVLRDGSIVGCGSAFPSVHVICRNCGKKKIMFIGNWRESRIKIEKTIKRQKGIKDQRLDLSTEFRRELE